VPCPKTHNSSCRLVFHSDSSMLNATQGNWECQFLKSSVVTQQGNRPQVYRLGAWATDVLSITHRVIHDPLKVTEKHSVLFYYLATSNNWKNNVNRDHKNNVNRDHKNNVNRDHKNNVNRDHKSNVNRDHKSNVNRNHKNNVNRDHKNI